MDSSNHRCSKCVCHDRRCNSRIFSSQEWNEQQKNEQKISSSLVAVDCRINILSQEINALQSRLSSLQRELSLSLVEHAQLRKHHQFLKERGRQMLLHNSSIIKSSASEHSVSLTASSELPNLSESQMSEILHWSPGPSELVAVDEILESSHGNLSSS
ncbi:hypothetical protein VTN96DRAFT_7619 [Rasamsonia emersonii]